MKKYFCAILTVAMVMCFFVQSFASETQQKTSEIQQKTIDDCIEPNSRVVSVGFNLSNSMAGFGYNVITDNIFDCVPSYGNTQTWQAGSLRYLRVRPGTTVTIAGAFHYRTFFGKIRLKEFVREVYVPKNTKLIIVE